MSMQRKWWPQVDLGGLAPEAAWRRDLGELLRVVRLGNLTDEAALEVLERNGVSRSTAGRVAPLAHGHPLSLQLAVGALFDRLDQLVAVAGLVFEKRQNEELGAALLGFADRAPGLHRGII